MHTNEFFQTVKRSFILMLFLQVFVFGQNHQEKIAQILASVPGSANYGIVVYNPMTEVTVFAYRDTVPLIPASTTKLFTTSSVLKLLKPDFYLYTGFFYDPAKVKGKTLRSNLYIKGYGYPLLTSEELKSMVTELKNSGITAIEGDIIGDDTYFDDEYSRNDWVEGDEEQIRIPDVSALTLDRNVKMAKKKVGRGRRKRWKTTTVFVNDIPKYVAVTTKEMMKKSGISVHGTAIAGEMPDGENMKCTVKRGARLLDVMKQVNKRSDNFLAENLFKVLGAEFSGEQGTSFAAGQAVHTFLEDNDINYSGTKVVDGSGLSRSNRVTVRSIANLLQCMYVDEKDFNSFSSTLSIAGDDGTLRGRMIGTKAEGNFRGKTGTLRGASSVAGYLKCASGEDLIVAMIFEYTDYNSRFYKNIQDAIIVYLADNY